jgi:hypothetical protein
MDRFCFQHTLPLYISLSPHIHGTTTDRRQYPAPGSSWSHPNLLLFYFSFFIFSPLLLLSLRSPSYYIMPCISLYVCVVVPQWLRLSCTTKVELDQTFRAQHSRNAINDKRIASSAWFLISLFRALVKNEEVKVTGCNKT